MPASIRTTMRNGLRSAIDLLREFAYAVPRTADSPGLAQERPRIGLALGGGFARGLAHLGVLKVLVENRVRIDALAGTSVGSIVAAGFAGGLPLDDMIEEACRVRWKDFARWTVNRLGLATNERMEGWLRSVLPCRRFEQLTIPLAVVAADITSGEAVAFRHGNLIPPLRASCSFPGLFIPVEYQGRLLVDGALVGSVPVAALGAFGVDAIVAVHLKANAHRHVPTNLFQVVGQSFQITQTRNDSTWREICDVVIEPNVNDFNWDDFRRAEELIASGELAARRALPSLGALLQRRIPERVSRVAFAR